MKMKKVFEVDQEELEEILKNYVLDRHDGIVAESVVVEFTLNADSTVSATITGDDANG